MPKEIYGGEWGNISDPKNLGKLFKNHVSVGKLINIKHLGIRNTGRCDEYQKT